MVDSLKEAGGWNEMMLDRMAGVFTGQVGRQALFAMFGGGRGGSGDPEAFRDRPGESFGAGGGASYGQMRELAELVMPGVGFGTLMRRFGGGRGEAKLVDPGQYTLSLTIDGETHTRTLTVERRGDLTGENSPFEAEWDRLVRRVEGAR